MTKRREAKLGPKGRPYGGSARYFLKERKHIPKGEKYLSESSHEGKSKGES